MLTTDDILTTCGKYPERMHWVSPAIRANAAVTAARVSALLVLFGESRPLTSGFRDPESNQQAGGAVRSKHMLGQAADIEDADGKLKAFVKDNPDAVCDAGLWCEPLSMTSTWLHVQTVPNPQGKRVPL